VASTLIVGVELELGTGLKVGALGIVGVEVEPLTAEGAAELEVGVDPLFVPADVAIELGAGVVSPLVGFSDGVALAWLNTLSS
jgi:hypothetical protein